MRKEGAAVAFELGHSAEVARLAGIMAREVGLDSHVAVRAAFLHDIGKAIDREMEGTHLQIGIDFLRKHGESEAVVMAMAAHHMDIDWPSLEAMIVQAADAISAARPGARRDILSRTSNAWKNSKASPIHSRACRSRSLFRPDARSGS